MSSRISQLLELTAAMIVAGGVLAMPAFALAGPTAVEGVAYAVLLCLVPGLILTLRAALVGTPADPLTALVLGMSLRLAVVTLGGLMICLSRPDMRGATFLFWLVPLYCLALAVESRQALRADPSTVRPSASSGPRIRRLQ